MHELDFSGEGFEWIDFGDYERSIVSFIRRARDRENFLVFVYNMTPVPRYNYRIGVPRWGFYREALNSDSALYWGSNMGNQGGRHTEPVPWHGRPCSLSLDFAAPGRSGAQTRLILRLSPAVSFALPLMPAAWAALLRFHEKTVVFYSKRIVFSGKTCLHAAR
jgi:hypothetical protein